MDFTPRLIGQTENALRALLERHLTGTGLTYHTWVLLNATVQSGGEADRVWLAALATDALKIDQAGVDAGIAALAGAGLVTADAASVRATGSGRELHERTATKTQPYTAGIMADLAPDDVAAAGRVLTTVLERANGYLARV
jgi:hypothetical protein